MNVLVPAALFAWPLAALLLFGALRGRRAVLACFLIPWLFLPMASFRIPGFVDYGKVQAASLGCFAAAALFDRPALLAFRPRWIDLPMLAWCVAPMAASLANSLGAYDGASESLSVVVGWGLPYLAGRIWLADRGGLRDLALAFVAGGLIYVPFCLFEIRMSPVLHEIVYGYHQHSWAQAKRGGGAWRPTVFMEHGLAVSMWMATAALSAFWLWRTDAVRLFAGLAMRWWVLLLGGTAVLCRSLGAVVLLGAGVAVLETCRAWSRGWPLLALALVPPVYVAARTTGAWSGASFVEAVERFSPDRAESVDYRFRAEDSLVDHALKRPWFGWGGWGRNRPTTFDADAPAYATDGLWIIVFGKTGALGLAGLLGTMLLPALLLARRMPRPGWAHPGTASVIGLGVILTLYMLDCLLNAMNNPFYLLAAGGLAGAIAAALRERAAPRPAGALEHA